ncbi:mtDNA inheritance, partitioning of the mitochondrial organelle [Lunasporangiospora selenospora]|uniref:MtDNA inheritance, partitioning of the mitochondrial organelle n=1 Tax=Lunasporangiospora selenospora TaxID=979761 RepID=A0A9P6FSI6_9FUNG|nr:mtDNA inheritance, partitioning of the mitochondrial organelle [Lunasporangiospora selenospora]
MHADSFRDPSKMETFQEQEYELSAYQQHLEDEEKGLATEEEEEDIDMNEIKSWSDYTRVFYHPKSMVTLSGGYQLDSDFTSFDVFSYGRSAFAETEKGIQVMADVLDGWGGFTASFLEQLREDFPKTSIITFGVMDEKMADCSTLRKTQTVLVNEALTTTHLSRLSSLYVPVRAPTKSVLNLDGWSKNLRIDPTSRYHTSAFISSAIDSALLPCRLRQNSSLLADEIGSLNWRNITTIGTLSASLPFSFGGPSLPKLTGKNSSLLDLSSRRFTEDDQIYSQSVVLRGLEIAQFAKYSAG